MLNKDQSWTLYRSKISYFSGKLEAFLKYKNIPFEISEVDSQKKFRKIYRNTGVMKMPAMESTNGDWLFDTTPTIEWLDSNYPGISIYPEDPSLKFLALLIEDYGDEWLWRPAMWWRWVPMGSRRTLGWTIGSEIIDKRIGRQAGWFFAKRQMQEWLWGDGVNKSNEKKVRDMLFREFEFLEALLEDQPFLLGSHPSIADYGYFASMFRHFGNDPDSAEIMRMDAPNTYEWLARLWNSKQEKLGPKVKWQWPVAEYWNSLLDRIANDYLTYLEQNASAYFSDKKRFDFEGKSISFSNTKTTHYRVWCFEVLQKKYLELDDGHRKRIDLLFEPVGGLRPLHAAKAINSNMDEKFRLPVTKNDKRKKGFSASMLGGQPRN
jgi:glutathione S-transferase